MTICFSFNFKWHFFLLNLHVHVYTWHCMYRHSVLKKGDNYENLSHCCIYIWKAKIMKNTWLYNICCDCIHLFLLTWHVCVRPPEAQSPDRTSAGRPLSAGSVPTPGRQCQKVACWHWLWHSWPGARPEVVHSCGSLAWGSWWRTDPRGAESPPLPPLTGQAHPSCSGQFYRHIDGRTLIGVHVSYYCYQFHSWRLTENIFNFVRQAVNVSESMLKSA